jgi:hypothetical protein
MNSINGDDSDFGYESFGADSWLVDDQREGCFDSMRRFFRPRRGYDLIVDEDEEIEAAPGVPIGDGIRRAVERVAGVVRDVIDYELPVPVKDRGLPVYRKIIRLLRGAALGDEVIDEIEAEAAYVPCHFVPHGPAPPLPEGGLPPVPCDELPSITFFVHWYETSHFSADGLAEYRRAVIVKMPMNLERANPEEFEDLRGALYAYGDFRYNESLRPASWVKTTVPQTLRAKLFQTLCKPHRKLYKFITGKAVLAKTSTRPSKWIPYLRAHDHQVSAPAFICARASPKFNPRADVSTTMLALQRIVNAPSFVNSSPEDLSAMHNSHTVGNMTMSLLEMSLVSTIANTVPIDAPNLNANPLGQVSRI